MGKKISFMSNCLLHHRYIVLLLGATVFVGCNRREDLGPVANIATAEKIREALTAGGEGGAAGGTVATGTGWGTLKGKFVFDGTPPEMQPYNVNKDTAACTINAAKADGNNFQVRPGSMWASYDCTSVESQPSSSCASDGFFVFENCEQ